MKKIVFSYSFFFFFFSGNQLSRPKIHLPCQDTQQFFCSKQLQYLKINLEMILCSEWEENHLNHFFPCINSPRRNPSVRPIVFYLVFCFLILPVWVDFCFCLHSCYPKFLAFDHFPYILECYFSSSFFLVCVCVCGGCRRSAAEPRSCPVGRVLISGPEGPGSRLAWKITATYVNVTALRHLVHVKIRRRWNVLQIISLRVPKRGSHLLRGRSK